MASGSQKSLKVKKRNVRQTAIFLFIQRVHIKKLCQLFSGSFQVFRVGGCKRNFFTGSRMSKFNFVGMECKSAQKRAFFVFIAVPFAFDFAKTYGFLVSAIQRVADNRKPVCCKMCPDLMCSSCFWFCNNPGVGACSSKIYKIGFTWFTIFFAYNGAVACISIRLKCQVYVKLGPHRMTVNQSMVGFVYQSFFKLLRKIFVGFGGACINDYTRSILIYTVNGIKSAKFFLSHKVKSWCFLIISVCRNENPRHLVEHYNIFIAVNCRIAVLFCHKYSLAEKRSSVIYKKNACIIQ